ncbi:UNVERIFIED_CONTAM: hypothetical protein Scaly_0679000 [Sesamum calycinum]|uniref:DUF4218 domain-containing protein n=1 Tax=Sesamum calycinum TaxID=2727403 RepID=A0AAW2R6U8_9LAMI
MVILDPSNLKHLINVYLELLIEELLQLCHMGVRTYDHAIVKAFMMRAVLMWTVNNLPAYEMTSGWSIMGVMVCPARINDTRAFHLQHGRKGATLTATDRFSRSTIPTEGTRKPSPRILSRIREASAIQVDVPIFERFLRELKKKVKNKAHVEASIVEAYIFKEIGLFMLQYFKSDVQSKRSMPHRNDERTSSDNEILVSIFNYPGRASGATKKRWLSGPERHIIKTYVLANCEAVTPYYELQVHTGIVLPSTVSWPWSRAWNLVSLPILDQASMLKYLRSRYAKLFYSTNDCGHSFLQRSCISKYIGDTSIMLMMIVSMMQSPLAQIQDIVIVCTYYHGPSSLRTTPVLLEPGTQVIPIKLLRLPYDDLRESVQSI